MYVEAQKVLYVWFHYSEFFASTLVILFVKHRKIDLFSTFSTQRFNIYNKRISLYFTYIHILLWFNAASTEYMKNHSMCCYGGIGRIFDIENKHNFFFSS